MTRYTPTTCRPRQRDAAKDFDTLAAAENSDPRGIWSDGTTMWVADELTNKIYAYNLGTKQRDAAKDFDTLHTVGNDRPEDIWSDGITMWVLDRVKIYAYNLATKQRDAGKDLDNLATDYLGFPGLGGIWSDGTTLWVALRLEDKIHAYNLATKERDSAKDFDTLDPIGNETPRGIWSDGTTLWVTDWYDDTIYAYNLATKQRDPGKDFNNLPSSINHGTVSIWSDGTTLWVGDRNYDTLSAFNLATNVRDPEKDFNHQSLTQGFGVEGIWSDGTTLWLARGQTSRILNAYNLATNAYDGEKDFSLEFRIRGGGIWSDGTTLWVASAGKILAYNVATKARDQGKDFNTLAGAGRPTGIWSDGTTMWVADEYDDKIYAYNMPEGTRVPRVSTTTSGRVTTRPGEQPEEPDPPPPSAVKAQCITGTASEDSNTGRINLGETIKNRWSGGCPSVTRGGRLAKYYTFSLPHTTAVEIALKSHLDDYLVLRSGDLGGTIVARDDDSGDINDSLISETLPAGDYTIEATTFYMDGVEAEFTLEAIAVDRVLYSGPASERATTGYSPTDATLDITLLPTLPLPTLQITIRDEDGFGPGQPGAAEMLLQGRIETDVGSPGSLMLAVPNGVWVGHGDITVHTRTSAEGSTWEEHTADDEQELLVENNGGIFGFLKGFAKKISSLVGGSNPLDTITGWLRIIAAGQSTVQGDEAAMLGLGGNPVSPIFRENHANCYSQVSVPWLVEDEEVTDIRISIPVILTDSEYVSVGAEFIARESDENEQSLVQAHDLLSIGQSLPACQRP